VRNEACRFARTEMLEALEEMAALRPWAEEEGDAAAATFALLFGMARKNARDAALRYVAAMKVEP
jgi:hypothetical protein